VSERPVPAVLSIAGSDSGGGAGIQADLKAFARCGVHGMTAIAALTAQSTVGVTAIHQVPGEFIVEQVRALAEDIGVDAVKIGMLGTAETVSAVREALELLEPGTPIVLDPVMVAESGAVLLDEPARAAITDELLPRVTVITPNVPEARVLAGADDDVEALARRLHELGPEIVVVTGGHRDDATDLYFDGEALEVPEDAERLVEEFRRQLDQGMWAAIPLMSEGGRREAELVRAFDEIPRTTDRVIFFPRAAGGAA
jgi:hydroxymethylpyrimidine/phosphomethylpyrimidine kinase